MTNTSIMGKRIYMGKSVIQRLQSIPQECKALGITIKKLAECADVSESTMRNCIKGRNIPPLRLYLEIGRLLDWDLSKDANYIYANRSFASKTLIIRTAIAFANTNYAAQFVPYEELENDTVFTLRNKNTRASVIMLAKYAGLPFTEVIRSITYDSRVKLYSFALTLNSIRVREELNARYNSLAVEK